MRKTVDWIVMGAVALLCGLCPDRLHAERKPRYEQVDLKESGTIIGVVKFEGQVPKPKKLKVTTDDEACHKDPIFSEDLVVSEGNGIKWAVASIKKIARGKSFPKGPMGPVPAASSAEGKTPESAQLDQRGCRFDPHVVLIPERRPLKILNSDGILHNVHVYAKFNRPLNKAMPEKTKEMEVSFRRRERIRVKCDVHKWMAAWIIVAEHPYYAVSGDDGTFRLEKVPAGVHTIEVWHETLGKQQKKVTVKAGEETQVEFAFKRK